MYLIKIKRKMCYKQVYLIKIKMNIKKKAMKSKVKKIKTKQMQNT